MIEFRGCFKEIARRDEQGRYVLPGYHLLPAPNRFRKMISPMSTGWTSWSGGAFDEAAVIARQAAEFPAIGGIPIGFEHDLFDVYLALRAA